MITLNGNTLTVQLPQGEQYHTLVTIEWALWLYSNHASAHAAKSKDFAAKWTKRSEDAAKLARKLDTVIEENRRELLSSRAGTGS